MSDILDENIDLLADLEPGERTMSELPYGGFLVLEHDVPALLIYRKKLKDKATLRLARTGASYLIIGDSHFEYFRDFIKNLTTRMRLRPSV